MTETTKNIDMNLSTKYFFLMQQVFVVFLISFSIHFCYADPGANVYSGVESVSGFDIQKACTKGGELNNKVPPELRENYELLEDEYDNSKYMDKYGNLNPITYVFGKIQLSDNRDPEIIESKMAIQPSGSFIATVFSKEPISSVINIHR